MRRNLWNLFLWEVWEKPVPMKIESLLQRLLWAVDEDQSNGGKNSSLWRHKRTSTREAPPGTLLYLQSPSFVITFQEIKEKRNSSYFLPFSFALKKHEVSWWAQHTASMTTELLTANILLKWPAEKRTVVTNGLEGTHFKNTFFIPHPSSLPFCFQPPHFWTSWAFCMYVCVGGCDEKQLNKLPLKPLKLL